MINISIYNIEINKYKANVGGKERYIITLKSYNLLLSLETGKDIKEIINKLEKQEQERKEKLKSITYFKMKNDYIKSIEYINKMLLELRHYKEF